MTIKAGSPEAHARSLKAAVTRRRNKSTTNKTGDKRNIQKQPFSAAYPHLEGTHVEITYGEYTGRFGTVKSTIPMVYKPTKDNPWILRVQLDGNFKSRGAALVYVPQTYLKRSSEQLRRDRATQKAIDAWNRRREAESKKPQKTFAQYVEEERKRLSS